MASNSNFDWVKPYNDNDLEITDGEGHLSGSTGFPLNWKLEDSNYGRLKRRATYLFETNNHVYTGLGDRTSVIKTATLLQHGQPVFDIYYNLSNIIGDVLAPTIVFNLSDDILPNGYISISPDSFTNALYFEISITPAASGSTWSLGQNTFTQVAWVDDNNLRPNYFNAVREQTKYRFGANRPDFYGVLGTYLENDNTGNMRNSYMFRMVYKNDSTNTKISTGSERDIEEYFGSTSGVTSISVDSLNSSLLSFIDNNGDSRTFEEYYYNLLVAGEENKFHFTFYTDVNPEIKPLEFFFSEFVYSESDYYIGPNDMLHFTITITPCGYRERLSLILPTSLQWPYNLCEIEVYIINCPLNPYLYLNSDRSELNYISSPMDANGGEEEMPVFSNRGWDITPSGTTEYVGYNE